MAVAAKDMVLGLIVERSDYGYSLVQRFEKRFGYAAFAESIVYSALGSLKKDGLIEPLPERNRVAGSRRGSRYGATQKGVDRFEAWMADSTPPAPMRDELRMKLALCAPRHVPRLIDLAWAQEQQCVDRLDELRQAEGRVPLDEGSTLPEVLEAVAWNNETKFLQATVECLRETRRALRRLTGGQGGRRPGPGLRQV
jgi:DNA-binding PadR family transcriptional regulator